MQRLSRRTGAIVVLAVLMTIAGCTGGPSGSGTAEPTQTTTVPDETETESQSTGTTTVTSTATGNPAAVTRFTAGESYSFYMEFGKDTRNLT